MRFTANQFIDEKMKSGQLSENPQVKLPLYQFIDYIEEIRWIDKLMKDSESFTYTKKACSLGDWIVYAERYKHWLQDESEQRESFKYSYPDKL